MLDTLPETATSIDERSSPPRSTIVIPTGWIKFCDSISPLVQERARPMELSRRFGLPTGLHESQELFLVLEIMNCAATVWLNQQLLGLIHRTDSLIRFSIREMMLARNRLQVLTQIDGSSGLPMFLQVRLEIQASL